MQSAPTYGGLRRKANPRVYRDDSRPSASKRGYGRRWQVARLMYLKNNPLCVKCKEKGRIVPATIVDHIIPHKGDMGLFWKMDNWMSLCVTHHAIKTRKGL